MPEQISGQVNKALANDSLKTKEFGEREKERMFEEGRTNRGRVNYGLGNEEVPENVEEGGVVTIKRRLEDAREFEGKKGKKKVKK